MKDAILQDIYRQLYQKHILEFLLSFFICFPQKREPLLILCTSTFPLIILEMWISLNYMIQSKYLVCIHQ